jgi:type I restriction enzyme S subunit
MVNHNWNRTIRLSETTKFIVDNRGRTAPTAESGIPLISTASISNDRLYPTYEKLRFVSQDTYDTWFRSHPQPGDIILTNKGSQNGAICLVPDPVDFVIAQDMVALRADEKVIAPLFLFAALRSPDVQRQIRNLDVSGVIPHFKKTDFDKLHLPYPERDLQEAIGCIYFDFCARIELNRRMIWTLEAIARAIFRSWFVDFDPVRAKATGKTPPGLMPDLAALFPDTFEDSELGEIPKGWQVAGLDEIATFLNGLALQQYPPGEDDYLPVIKIAQLRKGNADGADKASSEIDADYIVEDGDVLFSWSGSLECVLWTGGRGALNQHLFKVTSDRFSKWFYYLWVQRHLPSFRRIAADKATTMGHIQRHHLAQAKVAVPHSALLALADQIMVPLIDAIVSRSSESRTLATLRDALLPKLISGELRISDAENVIEQSIVAGGTSPRSAPNTPAVVQLVASLPKDQRQASRDTPQDNDGEEPEARPTIENYSREDVLAAIRELYREDPRPCDREQLLALLRDHLGFGALGSKIRGYLEGDLLAAVRRGILERRDNEYYLCCRTIEDYNRDVLKDLFLQAIGRSWLDREEAMQQAARYLGFQRTGSNIKATLKSVVNGLIREGRIEADGSVIRRV